MSVPKNIVSLYASQSFGRDGWERRKSSNRISLQIGYTDFSIVRIVSNQEETFRGAVQLADVKMFRFVS